MGTRGSPLLLLVRRLQQGSAGAGGASLQSVESWSSQQQPAAAGGGLSGGLLMTIIGVTLLIVTLCAWRAYRLTRWWASRARSARVLDEIEMEFVNDEIDEPHSSSECWGHSRCARTLRGSVRGESSALARIPLFSRWSPLAMHAPRTSGTRC